MGLVKIFVILLKIFIGVGVSKLIIWDTQTFSSVFILGNAEASRYLGLMYFSLKGSNKNLETSVEWFEKSSQWRNLLAQKNLVTQIHA